MFIPTEKRRAIERLQAAGVHAPNLLAGIEHLIELCAQQDAVIKESQMALEQATRSLRELDAQLQAARANEPKPEQCTYFVPYDFSYTQYANGGERHYHQAMTVVVLEHPVTNWQHILGIKEFIEKNTLRNHPNASVRINAIQRLAA